MANKDPMGESGTRAHVLNAFPEEHQRCAVPRFVLPLRSTCAAVRNFELSGGAC